MWHALRCTLLPACHACRSLGLAVEGLSGTEADILTSLCKEKAGPGGTAQPSLAEELDAVNSRSSARVRSSDPGAVGPAAPLLGKADVAQWQQDVRDLMRLLSAPGVLVTPLLRLLSWALGCGNWITQEMKDER